MSTYTYSQSNNRKAIQIYKKSVSCGFDCCESCHRFIKPNQPPQISISGNKDKKFFIPSPQTFKYHHLFGNTIITQSLLLSLPIETQGEVEKHVKFVFMDLISNSIDEQNEEFDLDQNISQTEKVANFYKAHLPNLKFTTSEPSLPTIPQTYSYELHSLSVSENSTKEGTFYCAYYSTGYIKSGDEKFLVHGLDSVNRAIWGDSVYFKEIDLKEATKFEEYDGLNGLKFGPPNEVKHQEIIASGKAKYARIIGIKHRRLQTFVCNAIDMTRTYSKHSNNSNNETDFILVKPISTKFPPLIVEKSNYITKEINQYVIAKWPKNSKYPLATRVNTSNDESSNHTSSNSELYQPKSIAEVTNSYLKMYDINPKPNTSLDLSNRNEHEKVNWEEIKLLHLRELIQGGVALKTDNESNHNEINVLESDQYSEIKAKLKKINPNRVDLTDLTILSIDPPGCTDIDDCLSIEPIENLQIEETEKNKKFKRFKPRSSSNVLKNSSQNQNSSEIEKNSVSKNNSKMFRIGIHIADVSSFIPANSACNQEAQARSTTVYLNQHRIDMIPEIFSSDLCSLRSKCLRMAMSVIAEVEVVENTEKSTFKLEEELEKYSNSLIKIRNVKITESLISSSASLTYAQADQILSDSSHKHHQSLKDLYFLSQTLKAERMKNGAINIHGQEIRVSSDSIRSKNNSDGDSQQNLKLNNKSSLRSNTLIEEMMILGNRIVGEFVKNNSAEWILRKHDEADLEENENKNNTKSSKQIDNKSADSSDCDLIKKQKNLKLSEKSDEASPLKDALRIRSMKKALYTTNYPVRHSGLALPFYTHYTSPIRRFPDLVVHRILKSILFKTQYKIDTDTSHMNRMSRNSQIVSREINEKFIYLYLVEKFGGIENEAKKQSRKIDVKTEENHRETHNVKRKNISKNQDGNVFTAHKMNEIKSGNVTFTLIYVEDFDMDGIVAGKVEMEKFKVKWTRDDYWWDVMGWMKFETI